MNNDCSGIEELGLLTYRIGGVDYSLGGEEYMEVNVDVSHRQTCMASIMQLDVAAPDGPAYVIGCTFIQKYFTVFDRGSGPGNSQVCFAKAASVQSSSAD